MVLDNLLWKPFVEASAQTIVGAVGAYVVSNVITSALSRNVFQGPQDFWMQGIMNNRVSEGDQVFIDGLISPYCQLFPGNSFENARRWRNIYYYEGKYNSTELQALEFFYGSDSALRLESLNGETLVGIYDRYGYVGRGLLGVVWTRYITDKLKDFFHPRNFGSVARVGGIIAKCPTQHAFVAKSIETKIGLKIAERTQYKHLYYLNINSIEMASKPEKQSCSLLGSLWSLTNAVDSQYLIEYGHFNDFAELQDCLGSLKKRRNWDQTQVYFDDLTADSHEIKFSTNYI